MSLNKQDRQKTTRDREDQTKDDKISTFINFFLPPCCCLLTNLQTQAQVDKNTVPGARPLKLLWISIRIIFLLKDCQPGYIERIIILFLNFFSSNLFFVINKICCFVLWNQFSVETKKLSWSQMFHAWNLGRIITTTGWNACKIWLPPILLMLTWDGSENHKLPSDNTKNVAFFGSAGTRNDRRTKQVQSQDYILAGLKTYCAFALAIILVFTELC